MAKSIRVAIVGATGYGGAELVRLLDAHPCAQVTTVTSSRSAGKRLSEECPWLVSDLVLSPFEPSELSCDFTFLCQEAGFAIEHAANLVGRTKVIDLSADFRLKDPSQFERYYALSAFTGNDVEAVYGLPELVDRESIAGAVLVANPGCYPTASLLALMPLVRAGLVEGTPVIDAKSGASGAGRSKKDTAFLLSELSGGLKPYAVTGHRHTPEIEQMVGRKVRFTPHLLPIARGLEATVHVAISKREDLLELYREFYRGDRFVTVQSEQPSTKQVLGSNTCAICPTHDEHTGFAVVTSVIDNLGKGAAGQAIQNMNLMAGLPEETGLPIHGVWP